MSISAEPSLTTVLHGGTILTMNPAAPQVAAIALRDGRIVAVGDEAEVLAYAGEASERLHLEGRCVLPGFHDSHVHLTQHGLELSRLQLHEVMTLDEALAQVAERARSLPAGSWILGSGFAMSRWGVTALDKSLLDTVAPQHPVFLISQDHHSAWVNSAALQRANISSSTPNPEHGVIVRDDRAEATGLLLEHASALVNAVVPAPSDAELAEALRAAAADFASHGVTSVHHMAYEPASHWRQLALLSSREDYGLRVWACIPQEDIEHAAALGVATGQGGERFMVGGAKFFADGALGSLTAWMLEPYANSQNCGMAIHGLEVMQARLPVAIEAGLTPVVHAIGDAANRMVIDVLEQHAPAWQARQLRPRIEHVQHIHPDDVKRLAALGVVASMQPYHMVFDAPSIRELLLDRMNRAYPWTSLQRQGAPLAFGSDTPVAHPDIVRRALPAACYRRGQDGQVLGAEECMPIAEALQAYTSGAAYAISQEHRRGQLRPGYDADLTLLSHNPLEQLDNLQVAGTMVAGQWTYPLR